MNQNGEQERHAVEISGTVLTGLGKGWFFMGQKEYIDQMVEKLGFLPYPGTMNVKVYDKELHKIKFVKEGRGMLIKGFEKDERAFGDVVIYKAEIDGMRCAVVMPKLSTHKDIIEIVAEKRLRDELKLDEGSEVKVRIFLS